MREDIQCLRGIAVSFVFIYHLFPTVFVNAFLGVDIFFVLSGYLMAKNLTRFRLGSVRDFFRFYYRRFKRVLPLYLVVVLVTVVLVHLYLGDYWWAANNDYALASLLLCTNQLFVHEGADYFSQLEGHGVSMNAFIHLWSLSVEMQFYLLVPFIFFALQFLKNDVFRLIAVSALTVISFVGSLLVSSQLSFHFMLFRLWQFSVGFIVLYWSNLNTPDEFQKRNESKLPLALLCDREDIVTFSFLVLSLCLVPSKLHSTSLRPLVTFATSLILASESKSNNLLSSSVLSYLGDLSYPVYLVHWPIIALFLGATPRSYVSCIVIPLVAAAFLHHLFEKRYLKFSLKPTLLMIAVLFFANGYLQQSVRQHEFWRNTLPEHLATIVEKNKELLPSLWDREYREDCIEKILPDVKDRERLHTFCRLPNGTGRFSILMIGDSNVLNFEEHMRAHFHYNYSDLRYISIQHNRGLYSDSPQSIEAIRISRREVEEYKPDVLLIASRFSESIRSKMTDDDDLVRQMNENIAFYEQFAKKVYILGPLPPFNKNFMNFFLHYAVQRPEELESLHLNKKTADEELKYAQRRLSSMQCQKCKFFELSPVFVEDDKYLTFDRENMLSYIDNSAQITASGMKLCETVLENLAKDVIGSF